MTIAPHGGTLINKTAASNEVADLEAKAINLPRLTIRNRLASDCEMIANGGFSPLTGFMDKADAESVISQMQLPSGLVWSIPVLLPVPEAETANISAGDEVALYDKANRLIALVTVTEKFTLDLDHYCEKVYKTAEIEHPGVKFVKDMGNHFLGATLNVLVNRPVRENIDEKYFLDPKDVRAEFERRGWKRVVAFQTRNPIHRAHEHLIKCALEPLDGALIHPLVGETKSDDIPADVRMKCYEVLIENYFSPAHVMLSVLPAAMRYAGPREAIHHMIMRKNYGCTHMIIGRDHAGVGNYYGTYEAQELVAGVEDQLGIQPLKFEHAVYSKRCEGMISAKTGPKLEGDTIFLSGTKVRQMLKQGERPPKEFSRPEVAEVLVNWAQSLEAGNPENKEPVASS